MTQAQTNRREFLAVSAATTAAAVGLPTIVPASVFAAPGQPAPSDRVVMGCIGTGDLGRRHHLNNMLLPRKDVQIAAVCDVDSNHRDMAAADVLRRTGQRPAIYADYRLLLERSDIDAVLIATPDHWHTLTSLAAMEAGKDVYCEKPLTLTIEEGRQLVATARRYGTVFQTGSQQRSGRQFRHAIELVRNGVIGKVTRIDTHIGGIDSGGWQSVGTPPANLDYNFWLGPAPWREYRSNQVHYQFRWFADFSGGKMTDWGAHHNDIAQWVMDADKTGPVKVKTLAAMFHADGPHDVAGQFDVRYEYANGAELVCHSDGENGIKITGSDGWIFVSRGRIELSVANKSFADKPKAGQENIYTAFAPDAFKVRVYNSGHHHDNWFECLKTRKLPICDVEVGHRSATVCHLGNIALKLGRELSWDPAAEQFVNDEQANRFVSKPMRGPWAL